LENKSGIREMRSLMCANIEYCNSGTGVDMRRSKGSTNKQKEQSLEKRIKLTRKRVEREIK
jgi:hypothetical protein